MDAAEDMKRSELQRRIVDVISGQIAHAMTDAFINGET